MSTKLFPALLATGLFVLLTSGAAAQDHASGDASQVPMDALTSQESTDLCVANFIRNGTTVEGESFSTWALGDSMEASAAVARVKAAVAAIKDAHVTTGVIQGRRATVTAVLDDASIVNDGAFRLNGHDVQGFSFRIDLDASLAAASFTAYANPEQEGIDLDKMRDLACTLVASATGGAPLPERKPPSRIHFRNPFKNERKEAQKQMDAAVALIKRARAMLYRRATHAGKAIVFVPMINVGRKYAGSAQVSGMPSYPLYRFDRTASLLWKGVGDNPGVMRVASDYSIIEQGLFGYIQSVESNKTSYGVYIVEPGSYGLDGLSYELPHGSMPALSSKHWSAKPTLGMASLVVTRNAEFRATQAWSGPQYQDVQVADGSYCSMTVTGGGVTGCANWETTYHNETRMTDPGGWHNSTEKGYAGGLAVSVTLPKPFARFEVKAGEVVVTDGFVATPDSMDIQNDACHQAADNLVDCGIKWFMLYRITGNASDLALPPEALSQAPVLAGFIAKVKYRPVTIDAPEVEETPGTYEAGWAKPYRVVAH